MSRTYRLDGLDALRRDVRGDVEQHIKMIVRRALLTTLRKMILRAPVGNPDLWKRPAPKGYVGGRFRGSIIPFRGIVPDTAPAEGQGGYSTVDAGDAAATLEGLQLGEEVGIVSNLPYSQRLAEGWSTQAPDGWIDVVLQEVTAELSGEGE